jgi:hypothetical protein
MSEEVEDSGSIGGVLPQKLVTSQCLQGLKAGSSPTLGVRQDSTDELAIGKSGDPTDARGRRGPATLFADAMGIPDRSNRGSKNSAPQYRSCHVAAIDSLAVLAATRWPRFACWGAGLQPAGEALGFLVSKAVAACILRASLR